jgi:hypothetical protein
VLPNAASATLAGNDDDAGKMPLTDFCNRPTARAPTEPLDSLAKATLRHPRAGKRPVDAGLPASIVPSTLSLRIRRGAPYRLGASLLRPFRRLATLVSSTSDAPCHHPSAPLAQARPAARNAFPAAPSRDTTSTLQSAFHRQMPPRRPLAQAATGPSPSSRRFRLRVSSQLPSWPSRTVFGSPLSQSPYKPSWTAALPRGQGVSPDVDRTGVSSVDFCNHYGS